MAEVRHKITYSGMANPTGFMVIAEFYDYYTERSDKIIVTSKKYKDYDLKELGDMIHSEEREHIPEFHEFRQYHTCEHKLIRLARERGDLDRIGTLTVEVLQKVPLNFYIDALQKDFLEEPSLDKLMETVEVGKELSQIIKEFKKGLEGMEV